MEFVIKYKYKWFVINISINKQLYTNTNTISDREIHVSMERTRDESKALHTLIQISSYNIRITSSTNVIQPSNIKKVPWLHITFPKSPSKASVHCAIY